MYKITRSNKSGVEFLDLYATQKLAKARLRGLAHIAKLEGHKILSDQLTTLKIDAGHINGPNLYVIRRQ